MTRYPPAHKQATREKLIEAARQEFREHGFDRASIDKLTGAAGLTRGGFYAHFESKEALIQEVLRIDSGLLNQLRAAASASEPREAAASALLGYLDPAGRHTLHQCPMVAHPRDAARGGPQRASAYAKQIEGTIDALQEVLGAKGSRGEATLLTVLSVGAAILAAAIPDDEDAARIAEVCRDEISTRFARR